MLAVVTSLANSGAGSLRDTIAAAPAGDTITFSVAGTITLSSELVVNKALTIDGGNAISISGNNATRVMRIEDATPATFANVTIKNIVIQNGSSATDGGGIQSFENLTLDGVTVENNQVTGPGQDAGGIAQGGETKAGGNLTILNSTIRNNTALDDGGALDHYNSNDLIIRDTLIESNISGDATGASNQPGYVGAIRIIDAVTAALYGDQSILFENLTFQNNKTVIVSEDYNPAALGGILVSAPPNSNWDMTVRDSTFTGNIHEITDPDPNDAYYSDGRGGALYIADVTNLLIEDTTFTDNYSYGPAGALQIANADVSTVATLNNVTMTGNGDGTIHGFAGRSSQGGGLWVISFNTATTNDVTINNSSFMNNTATFGGGINSQQGVNVTINDSVISGNSANRGAGFYAVSPAGSIANNTTLNRVTVDSNTAAYGGGGVAASGSTYQETLTINDSTISRNSVTSQPAGYMNAPFGMGGGVAAIFTTLTVNQSTISDNSSYSGGGGAFVDAYSYGATINRSTISGNTANTGATPYKGGGIRFDSYLSANTLYNTIVADNVDQAASPENDISGTDATIVVDADHSFIGSATTSVTLNNVGGSVIGGGSAMLGALGNNGGPTETRLPMAGSPVIDAGSGTRATDQRGLPGVVGAAVDIGSVELGAASLNLDFNNDTLYNCADMDLLEAAIDGGTFNAAFDVNGDLALTSADVSAWLMDAGELRFGTGRFFKLGDANLDGVVDGQDFIVWNGNKFTGANRWCLGDFNQDNVVDGQDFILWNANKFTSSDAGRPSAPNLAGNGEERQLVSSRQRSIVRDMEPAAVVAPQVRVPQAAPTAMRVESTSQLPAVDSARTQSGVLLSNNFSVKEKDEIRSHRAKEVATVDLAFADLGQIGL